MKTDVYHTLSKESEGFYKEKGSKFMSFAYSVNSVEASKEKIESLRKEYYDARHHCFAYIIGENKEYIRANDDGEPGHSAGDPILGQIKSAELTNTLVVVVRYFGGTKLGVSGLINAYKTAAELAITNNTVVEKVISETKVISFPYESTNEVLRLVNELELKITNQFYTSETVLHLEVRLTQSNIFKQRIKLLQDTGTVVATQ